jgi:hypothetical protein
MAATQVWHVDATQESDRVRITRIRRPKQRWMSPSEAPAFVREYLLLDTDMIVAEDLPTFAGYDGVEALVRGRYAVAIPVPNKPRRPRRLRKGTKGGLFTYADLLAYWSADDFYSMNRRAYKNTACGASVSVYGWYRGRPAVRHNGQDRPSYNDVWPPEAIAGEYADFPADFDFEAFTIQTIVEGSDATVDSDPFEFGCYTAAQVDAWVSDMEAKAERLWLEANDADEEE